MVPVRLHNVLYFIHQAHSTSYLHGKNHFFLSGPSCSYCVVIPTPPRRDTAKHIAVRWRSHRSRTISNGVCSRQHSLVAKWLSETTFLSVLLQPGLKARVILRGILRPLFLCFGLSRKSLNLLWAHVRKLASGPIVTVSRLQKSPTGLLLCFRLQDSGRVPKVLIM